MDVPIWDEFGEQEEKISEKELQRRKARDGVPYCPYFHDENWVNEKIKPVKKEQTIKIMRERKPKLKSISEEQRLKKIAKLKKQLKELEDKN